MHVFSKFYVQRPKMVFLDTVRVRVLIVIYMLSIISVSEFTWCTKLSGI
jgi:hypothetical protein